MRPLVLLLLALALAAPAAAQDNATANETTGNETPDGNATGGDGNATDGGPAAPAGPITLELESVTVGGSGYFRFPGEDTRNPRIVVQPGQEVTVVLKGTDDGVHNFCIGSGKCSAFVTSAGETQTYTFTAPESGTIEYYCQPHRGAGMKGTLAVGGDAPPAGGEDGEDGVITGETIDLGQYDPACAGKQAPASVRDGVVGAPTLQDYIDACKPKSDVQVEDKSGADLVIPISWALIGLGVVGVVWVHKYYKP